MVKIFDFGVVLGNFLAGFLKDRYGSLTGMKFVPNWQIVNEMCDLVIFEMDEFDNQKRLIAVEIDFFQDIIRKGEVRIYGHSTKNYEMAMKDFQNFFEAFPRFVVKYI